MRKEHSVYIGRLSPKTSSSPTELSLMSNDLLDSILMLNIRLMLILARKKIKRLPSWTFWTVMALSGIIIIIFNDLFGESDGFVIFGMLYFILLFVAVVRWIFTQIRSIISLKRDKTKMEMLHLKSQVNPHFFFNTLNNLYGLVDKHPKAAQNLILKLSDLMRYSIYEGQADWVPLEDEITYLKNYVEIQQDRYHKNVDIEFQLSLEENKFNIMPLLLILLVENAFKHGVEKLIKDAFVKIEIIASNGEIKFQIENNYDLEEENEQNVATGIGLKNLKRRLEIGYKQNFSLSTKKENGVYQAKLVLKKV